MKIATGLSVSSPARAPRSLHRLFTAALIVVAAGLLSGCATEDDDRSWSNAGPTPTPTPATPERNDDPQGCSDGDVIECKVVLPSQGDVENCFVGVKVCLDGEWSSCGSEA